MKAFLKPANIWDNKKTSATISKSWICSTCHHENSSIFMSTCQRCAAPSTPARLKSMSTPSPIISGRVEESVSVKYPTSASKATSSSSLQGKENEHTLDDSEVILDPDDYMSRKKKYLYGIDTPEVIAPKKKINLFQTLSTLQRDQDKRAAELATNSQPPVPAKSIFTSSSLSTIAAHRQISNNQQFDGDDFMNSNSQLRKPHDTHQHSYGKPQAIPMSARKLKEQNGTLSSMAKEHTALMCADYDFSVGVDHSYNNGTSYDTNNNQKSGVNTTQNNNLHTNNTNSSNYQNLHGLKPNYGEVIELDCDDDVDCIPEDHRIPATRNPPTVNSHSRYNQNNSISSSSSNQHADNHHKSTSSNVQSRTVVDSSATTRKQSRLEVLSDDDDDRDSLVTDSVKVTSSSTRPSASVAVAAATNKSSSKAFQQATTVHNSKQSSHAPEKYKRSEKITDDDEERSLDEEDAGSSMDDFIVDDDSDNDDDDDDEEDSNSDSYFIDSGEEEEVDALYSDHDHRGKPRKNQQIEREEIIISDDDGNDDRYNKPVRYRKGEEQEEYIIDDDSHDYDDGKYGSYSTHKKNHKNRSASPAEEVFDLTAGFVHHTRNALNSNPQFRELTPKFPHITAHYWSVKQLSREGCCAIDFNLFTLNAGATNPNSLGIGKSSSSKSTAKAPLSVEESYAKRRAARDAKDDKKRRIAAARLAKRRAKKSAGRGGSRRRTAGSTEDGEGNGDGHDGGDKTTAVKKKKAYFTKAKFYRKR